MTPRGNALTRQVMRLRDIEEYEIAEDINRIRIRNNHYFRRQQVLDHPWELISFPTSLFTAAKTRLHELRQLLLDQPDKHDEIMMEAENITGALDDIRKIRGWLVFSLGWEDSGDRPAMTAEEREQYMILAAAGKRLRGQL